MRLFWVAKIRVVLILGAVVLFLAAGAWVLSVRWSSLSTTSFSDADGRPVYQGSSEKKAIALTCNVFWGEEFVPRMLAIMEEKEMQMTFFVGGTWAEKFPQLTKQIMEAGHEIGSHGYSHPHPDRLSRQDNLEDILKCEQVLKEITGEKPSLFAPPYGERGPAVLQAAEEAGYTTILWSIDTVDWKHPKPEAIVNKITQNAHNGAIVLMHPTAPTVAALPQIIDKLREQGFSMVTVGELLRDEQQEKSS